MAVTSALSPAVVKTELDAIFVQNYDWPADPGIATVETPEIFKQAQMTNAAHIEEVLGGGGGYWPQKGEEQAVASASPRVANKATYYAATFAQSLEISKEFFDDNMHGTYAAMVEKFAFNARATRENVGFGLYRNSFTTALTADGAPIISASHTTITGLTVSNVVSGNPVLTPTSLNTAMTQMQQMVSQDGIIMGQLGRTLLVASANYKNACEIVGSTLVSNSANNAINVFSSTYQIMVFQSPYLSTAAGGNDNAWWLLSRNHGMTRYIREGVTTALIDYRFSTNDNYVYKGRYREQYGCTDYVGIVGSNPS